MTYTIARMNDEGNWVALESFETYNEADMNLDWYGDQYPNAYLDIASLVSTDSCCASIHTQTTTAI
jgi:hypothetical protein